MTTFESSYFFGKRFSGGQVIRDGEPFSPIPSQKIINHSPSGFNWGYEGSGPAQLALALLLDVSGDRNLALGYYQDFKREVISKLPAKWVLTSEDILCWFSEIRGRYEKLSQMHPFAGRS